MTTEVKEKNGVTRSSLKNPTIIETTYEKVLSIINRVKDFIKKTSKDSNNLIEDLEWVIKVITNKSLYTYELKQQKLSKQNAEYNKFISFVTKYNEEVIEMNKKHDIVSSILSIGKKQDLILKPSLCLRKIRPDELQKIDHNEIKEEKNLKNSFISVFGNLILNLYNRQKQKKENEENSGQLERYNSNIPEDEEDNENKKKSENDNDCKDDNNNENANNENNKEELVKRSSIVHKSTIEPKSNIENKNNTIRRKYTIEKEKSLNRLKSENYLDKDNKNHNIIKKNNTDENNFEKNEVNNEQKTKLNDRKNLKRIKINAEKEKKSEFDSKYKLKSINSNGTNQNLYFNFSHRKKFNIGTRLTKEEKITFNNIKKAMRSYYVKLAYSELPWPNMQQYSIKGSTINKGQFYRTNYYISESSKKNKSNNIEKAFMLYKNNSNFPHNMISKSKKNNKKKSNDNYVIKNHKIVKSLKNNLILEANEGFNTFNYESHKTNHNKQNKLQLSKRYQPGFKSNNSFIKENNIYNIKTQYVNSNSNKIENEANSIDKDNNDNENHMMKLDKTKTEEERKTELHNNMVSIKSLIDKNFDEVKMITDKDFNIFEFKKKMGHKNVLPIMGFVILKTLGLIDSKIISTRKLDSFLFSVSNNYKMSTLYHNSLHGADVTQSLCVYFLNSNIEEICETTVLDLLGIIVSAMGHDLGHPGLNNNYLINASSDLAITYNDSSCLENFHTSYLFKILKQDENNIIEKLSVQNYKTLRKRMISQILATDMVHHGENITLIRSKIKAWQEVGGGQTRFNLLTGNEKTKFDEQQLLLNYLIHMADLGHNTKKFEISRTWVKLLCEEFWKQGDKEKAKGLPISFMCDRNNTDVPGSQVGFLRGFIVSSFDCLVSMFPNLRFTIENAENNIKEWKKLQDEKNLLGFTPEKDKEKKEEEEKKNNDN
jgi:hypothetical protein